MAGLVRRVSGDAIQQAGDAPGAQAPDGRTETATTKRIRYDRPAHDWDQLPKHVLNGLQDLGLCTGQPIIKVLDVAQTRRRSGSYTQHRRAIWGETGHFVDIHLSRPLRRLEDQRFKPTSDWSASVDVAMLDAAEYTEHQWGGMAVVPSGSPQEAGTPHPAPLDVEHPGQVLHPGLIHQLGDSPDHWARRTVWDDRVQEQLYSIAQGLNWVRMISAGRTAIDLDALDFEPWVADNYYAPVRSRQHHDIHPPERGLFGRSKAAAITSQTVPTDNRALASGNDRSPRRALHR